MTKRVTFQLRIDEDLKSRIEEAAERESDKRGYKVSMSNMVTACLVRFIERHEQEQ
jgi:hypothetical protein